MLVDREVVVIEMLLPQQQSLLTELIQNTVVRVCVEHVPFDGRLELDGLVCINSDVGGARQIVVKIHTVVGRKDVFAERMIAQKSVLPVIPFTASKNGLSQSKGDAVVHDMRSQACEDASSAVSEALEDGYHRSGETADDHLLPWSRHAPQILKLLTKSEAASENTLPLAGCEAGSMPAAGAEKPSDAAVKREPVAIEDSNAMEVDAVGDRHCAKWRCKMCQLLCANFAELESHMRNVHVRFVCRLCLNSFTLSCNLRRHMKLHAGVRPHSCPFCSASFSRSTDLKIHMKKHPATASVANRDCDSPHSIQTEPLSLKKPAILHECNVCGKGFAAASHLAEHRHTHDINVEHRPVTENDKPISVDEPITSKADSSHQSDVVNGSAAVKPESVPVVVPGPIDLSETVREFAPLFHLGDAGGIGAVESDRTSLFLAAIAQHTNTAKAAAPARSKRKGLPVKRIDVGADDFDVADDDGESQAKDSLVATNETQADASQCTDAMSPAVSSQVSEEPVDMITGDLESKVFNCQYAGGCLAACQGFIAYERHYTMAHGGRYPCPLCPQSFTSRNNRRRHADGHAGAAGHGRHQCVTCGKRFARADIIKEHRLTHTRSYQLGTCSKCGESCGTKKSSLLLHLKRCLTVTEVDGDIDDARVTEPERAE